jgi:hypothetical protein
MTSIFQSRLRDGPDENFARLFLLHVFANIKNISRAWYIHRTLKVHSHTMISMHKNKRYHMNGKLQTQDCSFKIRRQRFSSGRPSLQRRLEFLAWCHTLLRSSKKNHIQLTIIHLYIQHYPPKSRGRKQKILDELYKVRSKMGLWEEQKGFFKFSGRSGCVCSRRPLQNIFNLSALKHFTRSGYDSQ